MEEKKYLNIISRIENLIKDIDKVEIKDFKLEIFTKDNRIFLRTIFNR